MQSDEQAIRQLVETWHSASRSGDTEKVLSLMTDDVVFLVPGRPPMRSKVAFAAGQAVKRAGPTLSILRKQGGTWLLYRDANLLAVVP